jgi:hypothetical protein
MSFFHADRGEVTLFGSMQDRRSPTRRAPSYQRLALLTARRGHGLPAVEGQDRYAEARCCVARSRSTARNRRHDKRLSGLEPLVPSPGSCESFNSDWVYGNTSQPTPAPSKERE